MMRRIVDLCHLLASCCWTLEHMVVSDIGRHLALEGVLAGCRHGFRSQRSCEAQLFQLYHDIVGGLDRAVSRGRRQTDVVVVGFAGAFYRVPYGGLLCGLNFYGIGGSARGWIDS